jgi:hypothetical protein
MTNLSIPQANDPIVQILIEAYKRGLAIQQEREEKDKVINSQPLEAESAEERKDNPPEHTPA